MMRKPLDDDLIGRMLPDAELFTRQLPSAPAGTYQGNSAFQGISRIFSYRRVEALPLVVSVSMALDDVLAVWRANAIRDGLAGLAIFTVLTVLAMLMAISLRKREEAKAATLRAARQLADKNVILDALLSELPDGVRLLDHDLHLIAWNDRFFDIMSLDEVKVLSDANPQKAILRQLIERGEYGEGTLEELTARREAIITSGKSVSYRRRLVTGKWIEYRGTPMPDGGNLAVVRDVTREVDRETEITDANDKLGQQAAELAALAVQLSAVHQTAEEARRVAEGAKFAAEEANRSKSEFLTGMSHELRTPLNSILGFSQIIQSVDFGDQAISRYRTYAGNIRQAGDHLLSLINDLLDLAKVEAGRMELQEEVAELGHILKAVGTMSRERAHDAGIELIIETDREPVIVRADVLKLKQSLINVVSNAIKFTPAGGTVHVRVERVEDGVDISVTDTGIGIKPEDIPKVFDRFGQIDGGLTRKHKGTGLGMPLTRTLMELQGGTVHLRSELGKGTRVMLHLPSGRLVG
jgi:signal transduction histidine kinase